MSIIIAPLREELFYRLGLLGTLSYFIKPSLALLLSALVFSVAHLGSLPTVALIPVAIGGLLYGVTYLALGLPWAIALHLLANLQPLLVAGGFQDFLLSDYFFPAYLALTAAGLWVFISRLIRNRKIIFGSNGVSQQ
jgi:membrane protease YdiL (CAAX protease family)